MSLSGAVRVARVRAPSRVRVIVVTRSLWNFLSSLIPSWFSLTRMRPATPEGSDRRAAPMITWLGLPSN